MPGSGKEIGWPASLRLNAARNWLALRHRPLAEISGALGDLGTLLPLLIGLAAQGSVDLSASLVFGGLWNVVTGAVFAIPLPVQPMKAIAAAALSSPDASPAPVVAAAGQIVGVALLLMSMSGLLGRVAAAVPVPVVKGIQLGAGLSLVVGAGTSIHGLEWARPALDNRLWAVGAFALLIASQRMPRFPYALAAFLLGLVFAVVRAGGGAGGHGSLPGFEIWVPRFLAPAWLRGRGPASSGARTALHMAVGQLPLTTLNSVIAVSVLAADLFPDRPAPSVASVGLSVSIMNLSGTWFGAMPVCHGSGGLAAQYRFGARSGASVVLLGVVKVVLGLFFGPALAGLLAAYPVGILAIMVLAAGLELASVARTLNRGAPDLAGRHESLSAKQRTRRWNVMLATAAGILAFRNDAVGFLAGLLCHAAHLLVDGTEWQTSGDRGGGGGDGGDGDGGDGDGGDGDGGDRARLLS